MQRGKRIFCFLLAGVLSCGSVMTARADEISEKKQEASQLEADKAAAEAEKSALSTELNTVIASMTQTQEDLTKKQDEIVQTADELDKARIEENDQYESMKLRIQYMYENGDAEFIEILCSATSFSDLLNKAEYITTMSSYDRDLLTKFQETVKVVEEKEAKLKEEEEELLVIQNSLIEQQAQVETLLANKNIELANLEDAIGQNAKELQALIAEAEAAAQRQKEAAAAAASSGGGSAGPGVISGSGQLSNPCPSGSLTSNYGYRPIPTPGATANHAGIDIGAPSGTPVYAASDGTVTTVAYNSGRGNYIIVNHGNGLQTLYQHLSASYVSSGQSVSRGQNIGAVGSTGVSTGPHLHFEVHVNGSPVNPMGYL